MKSILHKLCAGVLIVFAYTNASFATQAIPIEKTVYQIHVYGTYAVLRFSPATTSTEGCGSGALADTAVVIDWGTSNDLKLLYAAVLAAQTTGKLMGFGVSGCHPWAGGVPLVYRVDVVQ